MKICGIDPGKNGGLAIIYAIENCMKIDVDIASCQKMPLKKIQDSRKEFKKEICFKSISEYLKNYKPDFVCIEKVHAMPSQGVVSMFTFGYSFGGIVGCCETLEIPILFIQPTIWKKVLFPEKWKEKLQKSDIIAYCQTRFGSKIPKHDGIADAICIALCGIEKICNKKI